jgi:hypothetical protein
MSSKSRRFEVLLPVRFNDGQDVPAELLGDAVNEIVCRFGAASFYKHAGLQGAKEGAAAAAGIVDGKLPHRN